MSKPQWKVGDRVRCANAPNLVGEVIGIAYVWVRWDDTPVIVAERQARKGFSDMPSDPAIKRHHPDDLGPE